MITHNIQRSLIFEDDAIIQEDFEQRLEEAQKLVNSNWDIIYLHHISVLQFISSTFGYDIYERGIIVPHMPMCTTAYAISQAGCKKALRLLGKLKNPIDLSLANISDRMDVYAFNPVIVKGEYKSSQINPEKFPRFLYEYLTTIDFNHPSGGNFGYLMNIQNYQLDICNISVRISLVGYISCVIGLLTRRFPVFWLYTTIFILDSSNMNSVYISSLVLYLIGIILGNQLS